MTALPPPPPPPLGTGEDRRRTAAWIYWLAGGLAVALVVVVVILLTRGDDEAGAAGEVYLEAAGSLGPDPYTDRVMEGAVVNTTATLVSTPTSTSTSRATSTTTAGGTIGTAPRLPLQLRSWPGGEPGLYGGTRDQTRCDKAAMLAFLLQNPAKAAAWVAAQNSDPTLLWGDGRRSLTPADLAAYFAELTPVTLLQDTRVTNHGYADGRPTVRQSVLQAGTAVLVDLYGVPRARCACGNPLIPPVPSAVPPIWVGDPWPHWDPTVIIVVVPAPVVITEIIIIDLDSGDLISRPTGSDGDQDVPATNPTTPESPPLTIPPEIVVGTGDVQVTLLWANDSDMDLHVVDPDGTEIDFGSRTSPSGGRLDVDAIPDPGDGSTHVENVFWPSGGAPGGTYQAFVVHYNSQSGGPNSFTLEVRVGGQLIHQESGTLDEYGESTPFEFTVEAGG